MSKKKLNIYIVVSISRSLNKNAQNEKEWVATETVEFVDRLRERHYTTSMAIGDYINKKIVKGEANGIVDYSKFESYIREHYKDKIAELDALYERTKNV